MKVMRMKKIIPPQKTFVNCISRPDYFSGTLDQIVIFGSIVSGPTKYMSPSTPVNIYNFFFKSLCTL